MFAAVTNYEPVPPEASRRRETGYSGAGDPAFTHAWPMISPPANLDEAETIRAAQAGDLSAFNHLVLAHQDSLYGWALSLVKDPSLAEDITQATFITAYEKLSFFRGGSLRAWLFTIARNRSFDELRRQKRHPTLSLDDSSDDEDRRDLLSFLPSQTPRPEEVFEVGEQAILIERLLARLPAEARQVLRLVDIEEMDYQEAARVLNLPMGTLKSRISRARLKMRELIMQSGYLS